MVSLNEKAIAKRWVIVITIAVIAVAVIVFYQNDFIQNAVGNAIPKYDAPGEGGARPPRGGGPGGGCIPYDNDHDGQTTCGGDCDDNNPSIFKGATEYCGNNVDEDCSGVADKCAVTNTLDTAKGDYNINEEVDLN